MYNILQNAAKNLSNSDDQTDIYTRKVMLMLDVDDEEYLVVKNPSLTFAETLCVVLRYFFIMLQIRNCAAVVEDH